ncbi:MAG: ferredoxin domain-containing protein [Anaerovoracaceae bacterium]
MIRSSNEAEHAAAMAAADQMAAAARTAPKGCGLDHVITRIIDGAEQKQLAEEMRRIRREYDQDFFERDARNVDNSHCVVLIGVEAIPTVLEHCGVCGYEDCAACAKAGSHCAFTLTDLGIAIGSAVSLAADHRIDNRVLYSAGKAALRCGFFPDNVKVCFAIPLSTGSKSIFFDRDPVE